MPNNPRQIRRLELAIQAIKTGRVSSIQKAARSYDVPFSTLRRRLHGTKQQSLSNRTKRKLTETEETTTLQWILSIKKRGALLDLLPYEIWLIYY